MVWLLVDEIVRLLQHMLATLMEKIETVRMRRYIVKNVFLVPCLLSFLGTQIRTEMDNLNSLSRRQLYY